MFKVCLTVYRWWVCLYSGSVSSTWC